MPAKLSTTISKIPRLPNSVNASLIAKYHQYMKDNDASERHRNNALKVMIAYANFLGPNTTLGDIQRKDQITSFLDTKIKTVEQDPDKKWITTWNCYLRHIKMFFRWLCNSNDTKNNCKETSSSPHRIANIATYEDWETPQFARIKEKRTKRLSPYSENDIWERDELITIINYEPFARNKAALTLFWDLDARNHEVTALKIKNIRLRESYGEGEIPYNTKTGGGPILLTLSFPYVRDWLNEHPFKNSPDARLICNLNNGAPVKPEAMWTMMKQLRKRIERMLQDGTIMNKEERQKLEYLLKTKKWNPYCFRHSAITHDSDYLPGYALNKKVRWSMNSKQPGRYIKNRMGDTLKKTILNHNGIATDQTSKPKLTNRICPKCETVNALENNYCSKKDCGYPLTPAAYDEIKKSEKEKERKIQEVWQAMYKQGLIEKE